MYPSFAYIKVALAALTIFFSSCSDSKKDTLDSNEKRTIIKEALDSIRNQRNNKYVFRYNQLNLGEAKKDIPVATGVFPFTNNTQDTLYIKEVKTSCHCLSVEFPKHPIFPNQKGEVVIKMDLSGRVGFVHQEAYVFFNTLDSPIMLYLEITKP